MSEIIQNFMGITVWVRAAILLFLVILLWKIFGKAILWMLSLIPYILRTLFRLLFFIFEIPIAEFHKLFGGLFYELDNDFSTIGEKVDSFMERWYQAWHSCKKISFGKSFLLYIICIIFIAISGFVKTNNSILNAGEKTYLQCEARILGALSQIDVEDINFSTIADEDNSSIIAEYDESVDIKLIVSGVNSSLLVRDVPSTEGSEKLEHLKNGDEVIWHGNITFSEVDGKIEPWVYVETENEKAGWCRLFYLQPEEYIQLKCSFE